VKKTFLVQKHFLNKPRNIIGTRALLMCENRFKVKGIFLDLDGTIVDSRQAYFEAAKIAFQAVGQETPEMKVALEIPRRMEQGLGIDDLMTGDLKKFKAVYLKTYYLRTLQKTRLIPNVSATLEALSKKAKLALITMRYVPNETVVKELTHFGIAKYFTHVVTALDTSKPKPSPEALIKCVQALDVEICDCLIAGDSVNDVRAGKAAGAKTVAVLSGLFYCEELAKECPDLILPDVTKLPDVIS
jgi:HAD superfamily hydrolase (TIGR01509 family)